MPYAASTWASGDVIEQVRGNNWETQYTQAVADILLDSISYTQINRQTAIDGAANANGIADFITGSTTALTAFATASTSEPLVLSFAAGNSTLGGLNYDVQLTTPTTWQALTASNKSYLFFNTSFEPNSLLHFDGVTGSTTTTDEYGSTWTFFGASALSTAQSKFGTASLSLNGSTLSYIETTGITNVDSSNWTAEGWFYLTSTSADYRAIISTVKIYGAHLFSNPNGHFSLWLGSSTTAFDIANNSSGTTLITGNTWHHWSLTYNSSTYTAWLDGTAEISIASTLIINSKLGGIRHGLNHDFTFPFVGYLDEFRLTKGISRYSTTFTPSTAAFTTVSTEIIETVVTIPDQTIIPPQYGHFFDNTSNSLLHFSGAGGSTTTTDNYGSTWAFAGGAVISTAAGPLGAGILHLPSTGSSIQATAFSNVGSNNWTMEGRFYIGSSAANRTVVSSVNIFGFILDYGSALGHLRLWLANSTSSNNISNESSGTTVITSSAWHHWALTYDSSTYSVWIDGVEDIAVTSTALVNSVLGGIRLGMNGAVTAPFLGFMDEFRFTKGAARYTAAFTPSTAEFTGDIYFYDTNKSKMLFGDPSTWAEKIRVFVGDATTDATTVTSAKTYYLKGHTIFTTAALATSQVQSFDHNLGVKPNVEAYLINLSSEAGYVPGDEVPLTMDYSVNGRSFTIAADATTVKSLTGTGAIEVGNKTTSTATAITMANWAFRIYLSRPF